jgi:hypothetical protein
MENRTSIRESKVEAVLNPSPWPSPLYEGRGNTNAGPCTQGSLDCIGSTLGWMIGTTFGVQGKTMEMADGKFRMANLKLENLRIGDGYQCAVDSKCREHHRVWRKRPVTAAEGRRTLGRFAHARARCHRASLLALFFPRDDEDG